MVQNSSARITSYNVCYTKLLRLVLQVEQVEYRLAGEGRLLPFGPRLMGDAGLILDADRLAVDHVGVLVHGGEAKVLIHPEEQAQLVAGFEDQSYNFV